MDEKMEVFPCRKSCRDLLREKAHYNSAAGEAVLFQFSRNPQFITTGELRLQNEIL